MYRPSHHRFSFPLLAAGLITALLFSGCESFGGDEYRPKVTDILDVPVEPNPVAVGDTAVFTCIVEDSLDESLSFYWDLAGLSPTFTTDTNQYRWAAPSDTGTYRHQVEVNRPGDASVDHTQEYFEVTVVENE